MNIESSFDENEISNPPELTGSLRRELVPTSYKIPCVVHQLQLAIVKFSEVPFISKILDISRKLSAKLRTQTIRHLLIQEKLPPAKMDQATRWSSKVAMTKRLQELKEFCLRNQKLCIGLMVTDEFWTNLRDFNNLLEPFSVLTSRLQNEQLTIPEFNEYWVTAMLSPMIKSNWKFAEKLKDLVKARRDKIDENPIIQAGIYLDPRFRNISLNGIAQNTAKQTIRAIYLSHFGDSETPQIQDDFMDSETELDPLEALISSQFSSQISALQSNSQPHNLLDDQFVFYETFIFEKKSITKLNVRAFWVEHSQNPASTLHKLSKIALFC